MSNSHLYHLVIFRKSICRAVDADLPFETKAVNTKSMCNQGFTSPSSVTPRAEDEDVSVGTCSRQSSVSSSSLTKEERLVVQHDYHDHAKDPIPLEHIGKALEDYKNYNAFPLKLYEMLDLVHRDGYDEMISWQAHGRCFVIRRPKEFRNILPRYFRLSKIASFQRQLNLYGFMRLTNGPDKGGYYHERFLRGMPWLALEIRRIKVKGTGVRGKTNPAGEPDFWRMPPVTPPSICCKVEMESQQTQQRKQPVATDSKRKEVISEVPKRIDESNSGTSDVPDPPALPLVCSSESISSEMSSIHSPLRAPPQLVTSGPPRGEDRTEQKIGDVRLVTWGKPFYYLSRMAVVSPIPPDDVTDIVPCSMSFSDLDAISLISHDLEEI